MLLGAVCARVAYMCAGWDRLSYMIPCIRTRINITYNYSTMCTPVHKNYVYKFTCVHGNACGIPRI